MRRLTKSTPPDVLNENSEAWTADFIADTTNHTKRYRYRHPSIKEKLRDETRNKCAYCESKVGHNTPGDVEHKIPSSVEQTLHFCWSNLTLACNECNRRKNNYFDQDSPFLDPYSDDVETRARHHGPIVGWQPGDECAEVTVTTLQLHDGAREQLLRRKIERIAEVNHLLARKEAVTSPTMRALIVEQLNNMQSIDAEYSAMVCSVCGNVDGSQADGQQS